MDQTNLIQRAWRAYQQTDGAAAEQPSEHLSIVETLNHLGYVVLRNERRVLAVYRIRNNGLLRRLRAWPMELTCTASKRRSSPSPQGHATSHRHAHA